MRYKFVLADASSCSEGSVTKTSCSQVLRVHTACPWSDDHSELHRTCCSGTSSNNKSVSLVDDTVSGLVAFCSQTSKLSSSQETFITAPSPSSDQPISAGGDKSAGPSTCHGLTEDAGCTYSRVIDRNSQSSLSPGGARCRYPLVRDRDSQSSLSPGGAGCRYPLVRDRDSQSLQSAAESPRMVLIPQHNTPASCPRKSDEGSQSGMPVDGPVEEKHVSGTDGDETRSCSLSLCWRTSPRLKHLLGWSQLNQCHVKCGQEYSARVILHSFGSDSAELELISQGNGAEGNGGNVSTSTKSSQTSSIACRSVRDVSVQTDIETDTNAGKTSWVDTNNNFLPESIPAKLSERAQPTGLHNRRNSFGASVIGCKTVVGDVAGTSEGVDNIVMSCKPAFQAADASKSADVSALRYSVHNIGRLVQVHDTFVSVLSDIMQEVDEPGCGRLLRIAQLTRHGPISVADSPLEYDGDVLQKHHSDTPHLLSGRSGGRADDPSSLGSKLLNGHVVGRSSVPSNRGGDCHPPLRMNCTESARGRLSDADLSDPPPDGRSDQASAAEPVPRAEELGRAAQPTRSADGSPPTVIVRWRRSAYSGGHGRRRTAIDHRFLSSSSANVNEVPKIISAGPKSPVQTAAEESSMTLDEDYFCDVTGRPPMDWRRRVDMWLDECAPPPSATGRNGRPVADPFEFQHKVQQCATKSQQRSTSNRGYRYQRKRRRIDYSLQEVTNLLNGVRRFGKDFKAIRLAYKFHPSRSSVDLYDKYRHMNH